MKLYLDNIIYTLQKSGGVSVVWSEILDRLLRENGIDLNIIEYDNDNFFRANLDIPSSKILKIRSMLPPSIGRYLHVKGLKGKAIFHSSYYRISDCKDLINVTTVHDFTYEHFRKGLAKDIHSLQKKHAIKNSKGIICVSENTKKDLLYFNPSVDEERVKVIYNGVSSEFYGLDVLKDEELKNIVDFESGSYVLYVGDRKSEYKNFKTAVQSSKRLNLSLAIVGGGSLTKNETIFLHESIGQNNFLHVGSITNKKLNVLYNNAFCLLYPSSYEGFGIPIIEAQKAKCPVVSVNLSSIPEVADQSALLVDHANENEICEQLLRLKNEGNLRRSIINKGLINADRFSWNKCYQETLSFYKELYYQ